MHFTGGGGESISINAWVFAHTIQLIDNVNFKHYLELVPEIREIIKDFYDSRYTTCLSALERMKVLRSVTVIRSSIYEGRAVGYGRRHGVMPSRVHMRDRLMTDRQIHELTDPHKQMKGVRERK